MRLSCVGHSALHSVHKYAGWCLEEGDTTGQEMFELTNTNTGQIHDILSLLCIFNIGQWLGFLLPLSSEKNWTKSCFWFHFTWSFGGKKQNFLLPKLTLTWICLMEQKTKSLICSLVDQAMILFWERRILFNFVPAYNMPVAMVAVKLMLAAQG